MKEARGTLIDVIERTHNVKSFRFSLEEKFDFLVGQFVEVIFDEENRRNKTLNKMISLSCCPGMDYIEITKKITESNFSDKLKGLGMGQSVLFRGAMGNCTVNALGDDVCFIVGGIGITPAFPMIEYIAEAKMDKNIILLYSNWSIKDIAFKDELEAYAASNNNIKIVHVLVSTEMQEKNMIEGFIDKEVIINHVEGYLKKEFFIFGPPKMVESMRAICKDIGLEDKSIKWESFLGY